MEDLDVAQLRAFLSGDDSFLYEKEENPAGYLGGKLLGDPFWHRRRSEIVNGRFVVQSRFRGQVFELSLDNVVCVVHLTVRLSRMSEYPNVLTWLVGDGGRPLAEVPWGNTVAAQAKAAGLRIRSPRPHVAREAAKTLRPERRLV